MECTFLTATLSALKWNQLALETLLATGLSVSPDAIAIQAKWAQGVKPPAMPESVRIVVPDGTGFTCQQMGVYLKNNYDPQTDDTEEGLESRRQKLDERLQQLPTIQDIISRLEALEAP